MENKIDQDREKIIKINDKIENEMRNKNIIGVFAFTRQLIKVIDTSHEYPSIYYENYRCQDTQGCLERKDEGSCLDHD